jgi:hypothetical protein
LQSNTQIKLTYPSAISVPGRQFRRAIDEARQDPTNIAQIVSAAFNPDAIKELPNVRATIPTPPDSQYAKNERTVYVRSFFGIVPT